MDELLSMRLFVKVATLQGFAKAASDLNISNSTATRLIASLENRLGARLLNRTTRSLSLTDAGRLYLKRAQTVIDEIDQAEEAIATLNQDPIGSLRIVAPVMFGLQMLAPVIGSFKHHHPKVVPEVAIVDRYVNLVSEGFDVGLMPTQRVNGADTVKRVLTHLKMIACATERYLDLYGRPDHPRDLERRPYLHFQTDYAGESIVFEREGERFIVRPQKSASSNNVGLIRQFALNDMGVAILPSFLAETDIEKKRLTRLLEDYRISDLEMNVIYPSRNHLPRKTRLFIDHVVRYFSGEVRSTCDQPPA